VAFAVSAAPGIALQIDPEMWRAESAAQIEDSMASSISAAMAR
jgi:hypothetical protein